jgi:hypothetical protein
MVLDSESLHLLQPLPFQMAAAAAGVMLVVDLESYE